jgi:hypothetical protein
MALPCKLILPTTDLNDPLQNPKEIVTNATQSKQHSSSQAATPLPDNPQNGRSLLDKGAGTSSCAIVFLVQLFITKPFVWYFQACHVYYLNTVNVDNLNGAQAISKALSSSPGFEKKDASQLVLVQFKVNTQGIFITDLKRKNSHAIIIRPIRCCTVALKKVEYGLRNSKKFNILGWSPFLSGKSDP